MEQFVKGMTQNDFIYRLQQLIDGSNDIRQEIMAVLKPIINLIDQLYKETDNLQQNAAMIIERLEDMLKLKNLRRALEEYKENFERTDIIKIVLYEMQKFSRQYQLSELERAIVNIETNRRRYQDEAFEVYNKIKNFLLDKIIVSTLSKLTTAIGKITANEMAKQFWKYYIPNYKNLLELLSPGYYELEATD
ncbi:unnamed protein product [Wuchereria bancrofti]|uniref:Uncharacterized protein n=1 Tax=Wuchereria bancrofti TaxID=6293 RepID=A0A3P7EGV5_WUCBA|nr:unnamed protein product [Wuchereria bancrofti]